MIKIGVCDDNSQDIEITIKEVNRVCEINRLIYEIKVYSNAETMVADVLRDNIEVVLLDIEMPVVSSMEVANALMEQAPWINVIFLTNRADMVFQSLRYHPFRFVRKDHMREELNEALVAVEKKIVSELHLVQIVKDKSAGSYRVKDIQYIESNKHYLEIHVSETVHKIRGKISECERQLSDYGFIRIHVGYLVNVRCVACLTSKEVRMENGDVLPISRQKAEQIKEKYLRDLEKFVNGRYI